VSVVKLRQQLTSDTVKVHMQMECFDISKL